MMAMSELGAIQCDLLSQVIWLGDRAATANMTGDPTGIYNIVRTPDKQVTLGDKSEVEITHMGDLDVTIHQKDGSKKNLTLTEVKVVK